MEASTTLTKPFTETEVKILNGITEAMINLGANSGLVSIVQSWRDTQDDEETLRAIEDWNNKKFDTQ